MYIYIPYIYIPYLYTISIYIYRPYLYIYTTSIYIYHIYIYICHIYNYIYLYTSVYLHICVQGMSLKNWMNIQSQWRPVAMAAALGHARLSTIKLPKNAIDLPGLLGAPMVLRAWEKDTMICSKKHKT